MKAQQLDPKRLETISQITLRSGSHASFSQGACLMEAVAFLAGRKHTDHPPCACPVISAFGRRLNDSIADDKTRTELLLPLVHEIIGTKSTEDVERRRAYTALSFAIREAVPLAFDAAAKRKPELAKYAAELRALPEIVNQASARSAREVLVRARTDAAAADAAYAAYAHASAAAAADAAYAYAAAYAAYAAYAYAAAAAAYAAPRLPIYKAAVECLRRMIAIKDEKAAAA